MVTKRGFAKASGTRSGRGTVMQSSQTTMRIREVSGINVLNVLIIDDEAAVRESCREAAELLGFRVFAVDAAEQAYKILESQSIDIILLDLRLPGASGLEALREVKARRPESVVAIITGYATVPSAVQAMKQGAFDYITKPFNLDELRNLLERATVELKNTAQRRALRETLRSKQGFSSLVGKSPEMERLYRIISKAAQSTHPVLIVGESGTGKELVARCIHFTGPNRDKPFIPVDCGSLVPTLIESELFGYMKGAFTGATRNKDGLLSIANGGTVFLDEIGELPIDLQSKLLRAIQEREIRPVGSTKAIPIDVRILAATNRDLEAAVAEGDFRRDLYFRLNVLALKIPPLRDRKQDIPHLVEHFLERLSRDSGQERVLSDEALKAMLAYDWPGNVRELENCIERAWAMSSNSNLNMTDLPTYIRNALAPAKTGSSEGPKIIPLADLEKAAILGAIEQLRGDKLLAAKMLGIGKTTLYRKLKEYASQF